MNALARRGSLLAALGLLAGAGCVSRGALPPVALQVMQIRLSLLCQIVSLYEVDNGQVPTPEQGLQALVAAPTAPPLAPRYPRGGYTKPDELVDMAGSPIQYDVSPHDSRVTLRSATPAVTVPCESGAHAGRLPWRS